jgi:translation initiation factor IF-2
LATALRGGFAKRQAAKVVDDDPTGATVAPPLTSPSDDFFTARATQAPRVRRSQSRPVKPRGKQLRHVVLPKYPTAKALSAVFKCRSVDVLKTMIKMGEKPLNADEPLPIELAELIAGERGLQASRPVHLTDKLTPRARPPPEQYAALPRRAAITCILGHINHGKTTLLDALRHSDRAAHEAGGITQDTAAYSVVLPTTGELVTLVDTPGHASFHSMRERGATLTDFALLIVSAVDGVQPLTIEAIDTLRSHSTPFIVVVTKCALSGAKPDAVVTALTQHNVICESLGGDVPCVRVSASEGTGLDELEAQMLATIDALDLRADHDPHSAEAIVVEAEYVSLYFSCFIAFRSIARPAFCRVCFVFRVFSLIFTAFPL